MTSLLDRSGGRFRASSRPTVTSEAAQRSQLICVRVQRVFIPHEIHPSNLLETLFMDRVLEHPVWHIRTAHRPTDIPREALPALVEPERLVACENKWYGWREREQVLLYLTVGYGEANAWVASADLRALDHEMARLRALLPERSPEDTDQVAIRFWTWAGDHTTSYRRRLDTYQWEAIRDNYVGGTQVALDHVMREFRPDGNGQLLLRDGPPGTGKTSGLRALTWQWRVWCAAEYIVDPDVLFGDQLSYLVSVLLDDPDERPSADEGEEPKQLWRLLILEDSGEFLTMDAKARTGQALSRFLNVVDGLIGQGLRLLVLVTSNEALGKLHPAVSRPGRCVQKIRFHPFTTVEANAWRARHGETRSMGDTSPTLAELYARLHGEEEAEKPPIVGFVSS
jgi:hypothetical protein